ncbi:hypothetical protein BYT27DRAFT_6688749 [Phlegmacium glaucopus]|nr:hypothetical protein BYT27DRAFT_6688749 [Phlegmacium glaucopus]
MTEYIPPSPMQVGVDKSLYPILPSQLSSQLQTSLGQIAIRVFLSFAQYVAEATGGLVRGARVPSSSFHKIYQALFVNVVAQKGALIGIASRLLPRSLAETNFAQTAKIMLSLRGVIMK